MIRFIRIDLIRLKFVLRKEKDKKNQYRKKKQKKTGKNDNYWSDMIIKNYWIRVSIIWRIMEIEEDNTSENK